MSPSYALRRLGRAPPTASHHRRRRKTLQLLCRVRCRRHCHAQERLDRDEVRQGGKPHQAVFKLSEDETALSWEDGQRLRARHGACGKLQNKKR